MTTRALRVHLVLWLWGIVAAHTVVGDEVRRVQLFNGKDLSGWEGAAGWWTIEDGALTSQSTLEKPCKKANYLVWTGGQPADFQIDCEFKLSGKGNSGIHVRSERRPNHDMFGYQADMTGEGKLVGYIYHHKRGLVAKRGEQVLITADGKRQAKRVGGESKLLEHYKLGEWNHYRIVCKGDTITLHLNGELMCHIVDRDPATAVAKGFIGLQMHPGPPMKVQYRNLILTPISSPETAAPQNTPSP